MRRTTMALNAIAAVFFVGFLVYTFIAREHLDGMARGFVTEKTLQYSKPMVDVADQALGSPMVQKLLSEEQAAAILREISEYRQDPSGYVADLTRQKVLVAKARIPNPLLEKVASLKERIRTFYDDTLSALITDLRIFSTTNLFAALLALGMAYRSRQAIQHSIVWFSFLMFVAVLYCSYLYVDDLTFFRILFRTHMGWWYPLFLCVVLAKLYLDYGRGENATRTSDAPEPAITSQPK